MDTLLVLAKKPLEASSLGKLLESHSSVYDALNNPDLDVNIPTLPPLPNPMDLRLTSTFSLWLNIHLPPDSVAARLGQISSSVRSSGGASPASVNRPALSLILSNTSEEGEESMVLVPSKHNSSSAVMVFETDEESGEEDIHEVVTELPKKYGSCPLAHFNDDDSTLTANDAHSTKRVDLPLHLSSSFIMPKISLSDNQNRYRITIVTSASTTMKQQSSKLTAFLRKNFDSLMLRLQITHLVLSSATMKLDTSLLRSSDLVFVVNDGTMVIPEVLASAAQNVHDADLPKLTIINVITTNYFINLVDIISSWRPFQIWKAPSLCSESLLVRFKSFVDDELFDSSGGKYAREFEARKRKYNRNDPPPTFPDDVDVADVSNSAASNSVYDSLVRPCKRDYKGIERQIRSELQLSQSFTNTDPLRLSSDLHNFVELFRVAKRLLGLRKRSAAEKDLHLKRINGQRGDDSWIWSFVTSKNVWIVCSFSMGLGVGVTVASGAATVLIVNLYDSSKRYWSMACEKIVARLTVSPVQDSAVYNVSTKSLDKFANYTDVINNKIVGWSHAIVDSLVNFTKSEFFNDILAWFNSYIHAIKSLSTVAMMAAQNGLEKTLALFSNFAGISL